MAVHGADIGDISYENRPDAVYRSGKHRRQSTSTAKGIGFLEGSLGQRGFCARPDCRDPVSNHTRSGRIGAINMVSGVGETRDACLSLVEKYQDRRFADRVFDLAWTHNQVVLRQIQCHRGRRSTLWTPCRFRPLRQWCAACRPERPHQEPPRTIRSMGYAISGDLPIVLLRIGDPAHIELVRQLVQAHAYWRLKGLTVDLVIWNEDHSGYRQELHEQIMGLIAAGIEANVTDRPGGIFVRPVEQIIERGPHPAPNGRPGRHHRRRGRWRSRSTVAVLRKCSSLALRRPEPIEPSPRRSRRCPARSDLLQRAGRFTRMGTSMSFRPHKGR